MEIWRWRKPQFAFIVTLSADLELSPGSCDRTLVQGCYIVVFVASLKFEGSRGSEQRACVCNCFSVRTSMCFTSFRQLKRRL